MEERLFTRDEILAGFDCLADLLAERDCIARISIVGGAVMLLSYRRPADGRTKDVDSILMESDAELQKLIWMVASRLRYPLEWLNQGLRGSPFPGEIGKPQLLYDHPNLTVSGASPELMLALKTRAARPPPAADHYDFHVLCHELKIKTLSQVLENPRKAFPNYKLKGEKLDTVTAWIHGLHEDVQPPHQDDKPGGLE